LIETLLRTDGKSSSGLELADSHGKEGIRFERVGAMALVRLGQHSRVVAAHTIHSAVQIPIASQGLKGAATVAARYSGGPNR